MQNVLEIERLQHKAWQLEIQHSWRCSFKIQPMFEKLTAVYKHSATDGILSLSAAQSREKFRAYL